MSSLSERIGLSLSACHRRVKILESEGVIEGYSARIDRHALGLEMQVFMEVKLTSLRIDDTRAFEEAVRRMPEVLECHKISGEFDYLLRVAVASTADYDRLQSERLSMIPSLSQMKTLLSLTAVKEFRGYHVE